MFDVAIKTILTAAHPKTLNWEEQLQIEFVLNDWLKRKGYPHKETQRKPEITKPIACGINELLGKFDATNVTSKAIISDAAKKWLLHSGFFDYNKNDKVIVNINPTFVSKDWNFDPSKRKGVCYPVEGMIVSCHGSHGTCYTVKFEDGSTHCYDPWELEKI